MYDKITLKEFLRMSNTDWVKNTAELLVLKIKVFDSEPEVQVNPKANFGSKLKYIAGAYNDDLTLKTNSNIKIVSYDFLTIEDMQHYDWN
ncbi:hypothetical protein PP653_gp003 [Bacillus phage Basilisk]|uniref:Uncharacterized protein n=1 Tax=Bacillus phage Basilisk TaxID=1296654 RepID=S5MA75_9CAUD|nr:hypothetical protein PP653_gp003 [Bacillus phage Basilisk]AGR46669.1 hypothetical protein BASILISK_3 [Bacillus phage Basilisk]